jgi:predicted metalloendopeptidase
VVADNDWPTLRAYLVLHVYAEFAWALPVSPDEENVTHVDCLASLEHAFPSLLGHVYVTRYFPESTAAAVNSLVAHVEAAFAERIRATAWMDEETRARALAKLAAIHPMVAHPGVWEAPVLAQFSVDEYLSAVVAWDAAETRANLVLLFRESPLPRYHWLMAAFDVNAYYDPTANDIALPAGILQGPFFNVSAPLAANYGALGAVIGHELVHGFDDQGREYDLEGNHLEWWSNESAAEFNERAECVVALYTRDGVNGRLTLGENIADLGGSEVAYAAYVAAEAELSREERDDYERRVVEVFEMSARELFFRAWAYSWCRASPDVSSAPDVDPHSPARFRVETVFSQSPEWREAFSCGLLAAVDECRVW